MLKKWLLGALLFLLLGLTACKTDPTETPGNWDGSNWDSTTTWK